MLVANAVVLLLIAAAIYLLEGQDAEALGRAFVPVTPAVLNFAFAFPLIRGGQGMRFAVAGVEIMTLLLGLGEFGQGRLGGLMVAIFSIVAFINVNRRYAKAWFRRTRS